MKTILLAALIALGAAAPAAAQTRPFDPRSYQSRHVGEPTRILVLATPHLSGTPENFDPAVLEPLLSRLEAFHPDAIAIEALPGRSIEQMWEYRESYPDIARTYGSRATIMAAMAKTAIGLDMPAAEAEMRRTLAAWPTSPTPADRRRLTALFAAAGDPASALVQWWRLDAAERIADDNVPRALVDLLATYETAPRRNENYLIATRLAVRLGLERIHPMDDQSDQVVSPTYEQDLEAFGNSGWLEQMRANPAFTPLREASQHLTTPAETLSTYRMLNSARVGHTDADGQWLSMIDRASPNGAGRSRVAAWETRNLRMAANIRETAAIRPGGRVLVIFGSAHKAWLDAYLRMMSDVEIVDAATILR